MNARAAASAFWRVRFISLTPQKRLTNKGISPQSIWDMVARHAESVFMSVRSLELSRNTSTANPKCESAKMSQQFVKGNVAVVKGAILGGCQAYYGYPITPA